jgi:hypothetical protein
MKRSEMREIIKKYLIKTVSGDAAKSMSEDILYIIEQAGMLPPTKIILPDSYNRSEGTYGFKINEWDEE